MLSLNKKSPSEVLFPDLAISVDLQDFWPKILDFFSPIFPKKDVWVHSTTQVTVPFHKLLQWLTYSYVELLEIGQKITVSNKELQTGLPEYRNGGLFVDFRVLKPKKPLDINAVSSDLVIEWRACTVILLDILRERYFPNLPLSCLLEGGTWAAGRAIAKHHRPHSGESPIQVQLDGTVFSSALRFHFFYGRYFTIPWKREGTLQ